MNWSIGSMKQQGKFKFLCWNWEPSCRVTPEKAGRVFQKTWYVFALARWMILGPDSPAGIWILFKRLYNSNNFVSNFCKMYNFLQHGKKWQKKYPFVRCNHFLFELLFRLALPLSAKCGREQDVDWLLLKFRKTNFTNSQMMQTSFIFWLDLYQTAALGTKTAKISLQHSVTPLPEDAMEDPKTHLISRVQIMPI